MLGIFKTKNEHALKANNLMDRVQKILCETDVPMDFVDVNLKDIKFNVKKNKWGIIPEPYALGNVMTMGLDIRDDSVSQLVHFPKDSILLEHRHLFLEEVIKVLHGKIKDNYTGKVINEGEYFFIPKGQPHEIIDVSNRESYLHVLIAKDDSIKLKPIKNWQKYRIK